MTTTLTNMSCGGCGRPTPYRIVIADEPKPCCGRLSCEAWARDGIRRPDLPRSQSIAENEQRRRYDVLLADVLEGVQILGKTRGGLGVAVYEEVEAQVLAKLRAAIANGAPEVA